LPSTGKGLGDEHKPGAWRSPCGYWSKNDRLPGKPVGTGPGAV